MKLCTFRHAGDVERAAATLEEHLRGTLDSVRAALAALPVSTSTPSKPAPSDRSDPR